MEIQIKNLSGTSDKTCTCGTWLDHWVKISGKPLPNYCSISMCYQKPEVGAHVKKADLLNFSTYIVPMCKACNAKTEVLTLKDSDLLVSANVAETCGKQKPLLRR